MLYILAICKALESAKDGKKVNVLCIVDRNHERYVVALGCNLVAILGILKAFTS